MKLDLPRVSVVFPFLAFTPLCGEPQKRRLGVKGDDPGLEQDASGDAALDLLR